MTMSTEPVQRDTDDLEIPHQMTDLEGWALSGHLLDADPEIEPHILRGIE
jgi:hypothetical protein